MHTNAPDELLDLVDDEDTIIGTKLRSAVYAEHLSNFRVVNVFLINDEGKMWIPRRTAHKRIFPNCLDMSASGHVESGETYDFAFAREVQEELNIDVHTAEYKIIGKAGPRDGLNAMMQVYEIRSNDVPNFNPQDFTEYFWLTPAALLAQIEQGDPSKSDLPKLVKIFYGKR